MAITDVHFWRFKQFKDFKIELRDQPITLLAGGNNSGKTSLLQGLAVWEFCKNILESEKGRQALRDGYTGQGFGLSDDEFNAVNVPTLKHLWSNLKTGKDEEPDGYTLQISLGWESKGEARVKIALSVANDRLFVKTLESNLADDGPLPDIAYLPPFAGMTDKEMRVPGAIRRRRVGEGLAGAVLRNILLDLREDNLQRREQLKGNKSKIGDADLQDLRESNPWELLQQALRSVFGAELQVHPFNEEYHSHIRVDVLKGEVANRKLKKYPGYNSRDLMVEGSGFLQWLSVYALAVQPQVDLLLLDEPDAHLHPSLQTQLFEELERIARTFGKQVIVATHSSELLREAPPHRILELRGGKSGRYLSTDNQKTAMLAGLGTHYAPRFESLARNRRLLFVEGASDRSILAAWAATLGTSVLDKWTIWQSSSDHRSRKQLFRGIAEEYPDLSAVSLRDRDDDALNTVGEDLADKAMGGDGSDGFYSIKWRRRYIEAYLLHGPTLARAFEIEEDVITQHVAREHGLALDEETFSATHAPAALLDARAKAIMFTGETALAALAGASNPTPQRVAELMPPSAIPEDALLLFGKLEDLA